MEAFLIKFILAIAVMGLTTCQESFDFKITTTAPLSESKLMERNIGISNVLECARTCSWNSSCAFVQYCGDEGTCALYENNANFTTVFVSCSNGKPPITVQKKALSCDVNKYLVTGPDGVADNQLSASSFYGDETSSPLSAKYARLNNNGTYGCWAPSGLNSTEHIQVDFLTTRLTNGVVLTGCYGPDADWYVTTFRLSFSLDCTTFTYLQDGNGNDRMFAGSSYPDEIVTRLFDQPLPARCIRINPITWSLDPPAVRFDVLGC